MPKVFHTADQGLNAPREIARTKGGNILVASYSDGLLAELDPQGTQVSGSLLQSVCRGRATRPRPDL